MIPSSFFVGRVRNLRIPLILITILGIALFGVAEDPPDEPKKHYADTPQRYEPYGRFTEPYERFFLDPLEFRGYGRELAEPQGLESVKIGFLGPIEATVSVATGGASHDQAMGQKMLQGAQLAIKHANQRGGYGAEGLPFELVVKNDNGLWGSSGNEIIDLAYREKVWAVLGTIDGANSHIAIRVALKAEIPIINTGDTDPSFVETLIPWAFRNITDDRQMSYLLADFVFDELGLERVAALRASNRYGRVSIDEFRDAATRRGHPFLVELQYRIGDTDFRPQLEQLKTLEPDVIVTWGNAAESAMILRQMRAMGMDQWLVGSDRIVSSEFLDQAGHDLSRVAAGYPWDPTRDDPMYRAFVTAFETEYGHPPETYAAHAYDGVTMLIEAIGRAGLNRARIRDELAAIKKWHGVTGHKTFDNVYSNRSPAVLALVKEGKWTFRAKTPPADASEAPVNKSMLEDSLSFNGVETAHPATVGSPVYRVGLFAPVHDDPVGTSMFRGATLAVELTNSSGGIDGSPMELVHRWDPDPWRGGAREVIRMVYDDRVLAIIGGPDGPSSHVAQQVATKAMLPLISPVSSDPSLTHTRVPWIFRLPPDDAVQAQLLVSEGVVGKNLHRIGLVTGTDHDSRAAAVELRRALERAGRSPVCHLNVAPGEELETLASRLEPFALDGVIVRAPAEKMAELVTVLATSGPEVAIFAPWVPGFEINPPPPDSRVRLSVVAPFEATGGAEAQAQFVRDYRQRWNETPSAEAAYSFDAVRLIADGLRAGARGRSDLEKALRRLDGLELASGPLRLDNGGGNLGLPVIVDLGSLASVEVAGVVGVVQPSTERRVAIATSR